MKTFLKLALATAMAIATAAASSAEVMTYGSIAEPPGVYFGSGNPNGNFNVGTTTIGDGTIEAALRFHRRDTFASIDGSSGTYTVPAGTYAGGGIKGKGNLDFSMMTHGSVGPIVWELCADTDPTAATAMVCVDPTTHWADNAVAAVLGYWGMQNSENTSFADMPGTRSADMTGWFTFTLSAYSPVVSDASVAATDRILLDRVTIVEQVPEPASIVLMSSAIFALAITRRRKPDAAGKTAMQ